MCKQLKHEAKFSSFVTKTFCLRIDRCIILLNITQRWFGTHLSVYPDYPNFLQIWLLLLQLNVWFPFSDFLAFSNGGAIAGDEIMRIAKFQSATLLPFWVEMHFPWLISPLCPILMVLRDSQRGNFDIICCNIVCYMRFLCPLNRLK